jgi:hypothetical protein
MGLHHDVHGLGLSQARDNFQQALNHILHRVVVIIVE